MNYKSHNTILKNEVSEILLENLKDEEEYFIDFTFGGGGHTFELLERKPNINVFAFDQDSDAIKNGKLNIKSRNLDDKITLIHDNYINFEKHLGKYPFLIENISGIIMDIGVSSHQFDAGERGFSFRYDADLDMRMNRDDDSLDTAEVLINENTEEELKNLFSEYGEERYASRIAQAICEQRNIARIKTTKELENIIFHCYPKKDRFKKAHPATKCFQALRIAVNKELEVLENVIPQIISNLKIGGKLCIISFHSLEDRIVKRKFKELQAGEVPCKILTKRPLVPSEDEIMHNSRARSAKLRVIERTMDKVRSQKNKYAKE